MILNNMFFSSSEKRRYDLSFGYYNDDAVSIIWFFCQKHNNKASDAKAGVRSYYFLPVLHFVPCVSAICIILSIRRLVLLVELHVTINVFHLFLPQRLARMFRISCPCVCVMSARIQTHVWSSATHCIQHMVDTQFWCIPVWGAWWWEGAHDSDGWWESWWEWWWGRLRTQTMRGHTACIGKRWINLESTPGNTRFPQKPSKSSLAVRFTWETSKIRDGVSKKRRSIKTQDLPW